MMFCPKCGRELKDRAVFCSGCGTQVRILAPDNKPSSVSDISTSQSSFAKDSFSPDYTRSAAVTENAEPCTATKAEEPEEEIHSEEAEGAKEETETSSDFVTADNVRNASSSTKITSKKIKIIASIALVFVVSIIIGVIIYENSDSRKIEKASELIIDGQYSEGVNKIYNIYTPQAMVIKNFVKVENAKQLFVNSVESGSIADAWKAYDEFQTAINEFDEENEIYYLPDNLRKNYDCYRTAFNYISEYTDISGDLSQALYNVQSVMMNTVERNNSSKNGSLFTLNDLQSRIDTSNAALQTLKDYNFSSIRVDDPNVKLYCHTATMYVDEEERTVIWTGNSLKETIYTLISECEYEIKHSQEFIDESSKDFEMDAKLYMTSPSNGYSSYVGEDLQRIQNYENIGNNRNSLLKSLQKDMLYFLIVGSFAE